LSKVAPKKYGDKIAHVGGGSEDEPIKHQHSVAADIDALLAMPGKPE
jgi:hypothetical protein